MGFVSLKAWASKHGGQILTSGGLGSKPPRLLKLGAVVQTRVASVIALRDSLAFRIGAVSPTS